MSFLKKYSSDPTIASALMTALTFLSGLSDTELAMVRHKIVTHLDPKIVAAREQTTGVKRDRGRMAAGTTAVRRT